MHFPSYSERSYVTEKEGTQGITDKEIIFDEKSRLMLSPHMKYRFYKKCIPKGYKSEQNFYIPLLEDYDNTKKIFIILFLLF